MREQFSAQFQVFAAWRNSTPGIAVFGAIELAGAVAFVWLALGTGNWIDWLCAVLLGVLAIQDIAKLIWKVVPRGNE